MILKCMSQDVKRIEEVWDKVQRQVFEFHKLDFFLTMCLYSVERNAGDIVVTRQIAASVV
jgi:hypothetical protein